MNRPNCLALSLAAPLAVVLMGGASLVATAEPAPAPAATAPVRQPDLIRMTLHPARATTASAHRLLPDPADLAPGDAVPLYLLARRSWPDQKTMNEVLYPENEKYDYLGTPPDQFPREHADRIFKAFGDLYAILDLAARRREAHWDTGWRERGAGRTFGGVSYLADIHHGVNLLSFRATYLAAHDDFAGAERSMQTSFALALHVASQPAPLAHTLLAKSFAQSPLYHSVNTWVARPGSPNLFWALSNLPQLCDLQAMAAARNLDVRASQPRIARAIEGTLSDDEWPAALREMVAAVPEEHAPFDRTKEKTESEVKRLVADVLPLAKAHLAAVGAAKEKVDGMSAEQALGTYFCQQYAAAEDAQWKAFALPYPDAVAVMKREWQALAPDKAPAVDNPLIHAQLVRTNYTEIRGNTATVAIPEYRMSQVEAMRYQMEIVNRMVALARTIEALRDYAATHDSHLPERLDQVTNLPIPTDPVTGAPFEYRLQGKTAKLSALAPVGQSAATGFVYELSEEEK